MALTEKTGIDKIEVLENGVIQVRTATIIERDGAEISKTYHRECLAPGDSLVGHDNRVASIAQTVWTPEVIRAYQASLDLLGAK